MKYDWKPISQSDTEIILSVTFEDPYQVSSVDTYVLQVTLWETSLFRSSENFYLITPNQEIQDYIIPQ